jgi:drug/metabolite transporter (DMT)-like permease
MMGAAALVRRLGTERTTKRETAGPHTTSGRWRLGVALSLGAVLMWGLLPIALSGLLEQMSALTITWYRFVVAGVVLVFPVLRSRGLSPVAGAGRSVVSLVLALTPLVTIAAVTMGSRALPSLIRHEQLGTVSLLGAALVVGGSILGALGRASDRP